MIDSLQQEMEAIFDRVIRELPSSDKKRVVSLTKEIDDIDPLHFFEGAKHIGKNRIYWKNMNDGFVLVGAGKVLDVVAEEDRFRWTEKRIDELIDQALIKNPYKLPGTGLVLLGGMKFDPKQETSSLWKNFQTSRFTLPEFLLTRVHNRTFLTVNSMVQKEDHPAQLASWLKQKEEQLFARQSIPNQVVSVKIKKEKDIEKWLETIEKVKNDIRNGKSEKVVLAREIRIRLNEPVILSTVLQGLTETQPNSYVFAFEESGDCFVGATPERLVRVDQRSLLSTCLAGTAARGKTKEEDEKIGDFLLNDQKNREEHDFVVQMIKKAVTNYSTDVTIPNAPVLYRLKNLQHLYTPVTATLKKEYSIFDVVEQLHPTPALGGTPTEEALAFIRNYEPMDRGWYGAPVGWVDSNDSGEFAVAIRSGLIQGDEASLFAGCGIVKDSDPKSEYEETAIKMLPMLSVLGGNK
jgi:menaquinone-specific isochorismate synthase